MFSFHHPHSHFGKLWSSLITLAAAIVCMSITDTRSATPFQQHPPKSKIELELENQTRPAKKAEDTKKTRSSARVNTGRLAPTRDPSITFVSDQPGVEISIDGLVVGTTDVNKRLTARVKRGTHKATASLKGYTPQTITISVVADRATHTLSLGKPLPPPTPAPSPVAKAEDAPEPEPEPAPPSTDEIIKRFIDPNETTKLTSADWKEVVSQSEQALKHEPTSSQFLARRHLGLGQLAYLKGNYAESLSEFNRAIEALPRSGIAYYGLGNAYLATNQPLQAIKSYQRASELTTEMTAVAYKGIGDALTKMDKGAQANSSYKRAREMGYASSDINKNIGINLIKEKEWQKALVELTAIEDNQFADLQLYIGECYENLKRPLSAYRAYATATKLDPNFALAFSKLGNLLFENNEYPEARDAYERALALDTTGGSINRPLLRKLADKAAELAKP
jgi:tetratricopeptide (TPR) repeat protein